MASKSKSAALDQVYVGIRGRVVALKKADGEIAWSTKLPRGATFVPILEEGRRLYAVSGGEVCCLDAADGTIVWHNPLKGCGIGYACLSSTGFPTAAAALEQQAAAASAAY